MTDGVKEAYELLEQDTIMIGSGDQALLLAHELPDSVTNVGRCQIPIIPIQNGASSTTAFLLRAWMRHTASGSASEDRKRKEDNLRDSLWP